MPPKKKLVKTFTLQLPAGQATPAPPVGPALGQHGVNIMEFCKSYNAQTESQRGDIVPAEISVYEDRTFTFILKTPPAARLLLKAAGVQKGSGVPQTDKVGSITRPSCARSPRRRWPTSTPTTSTRPRRSSPAPPGRWASPSRTDAGPARSDVGGRAPTAARTETTGVSRMQRSKSYRKAAEPIDRSSSTRPLEAVKLAKDTTTAKFDATVEVAMRLGVDPRKADQMVRGTVNLPHGTGKTARVIVFAPARRPRRPRPPAPTRWAPTSSSPGSRRAGWTSTRRSPRPTRWPRSAGSRGSWARAA